MASWSVGDCNLRSTVMRKAIAFTSATFLGGAALMTLPVVDFLGSVAFMK